MNERFKKIREKQGLNQKEFAEKLGTTQGNISKYEKGELDIKTDIQRKLAENFQVNIHWLVTGQGEPEFKDGKQTINGNKNIQIENMQNSSISQFQSNDKAIHKEILQDLQKLPKQRQQYYYHKIKAETFE